MNTQQCKHDKSKHDKIHWRIAPGSVEHALERIRQQAQSGHSGRVVLREPENIDHTGVIPREDLQEALTAAGVGSAELQAEEFTPEPAAEDPSPIRELYHDILSKHQVAGDGPTAQWTPANTEQPEGEAQPLPPADPLARPRTRFLGHSVVFLFLAVIGIPWIWVPGARFTLNQLESFNVLQLPFLHDSPADSSSGRSGERLRPHLRSLEQLPELSTAAEDGELPVQKRDAAPKPAFAPTTSAAQQAEPADSARTATDEKATAPENHNSAVDQAPANPLLDNLSWKEQNAQRRKSKRVRPVHERPAAHSAGPLITATGNRVNWSDGTKKLHRSQAPGTDNGHADSAAADASRSADNGTSQTTAHNASGRPKAAAEPTPHGSGLAEPESGWFIQFAALPSRQAAEHAARPVLERGHPAAVEHAIVKGKTYYRVLIGPRATRGSAAGLLRELQDLPEVRRGFVRRVK